MKNTLFLALFCLAAAFPPALTAQTQPEPKVLFIGIDGVRSDALQQAITPNLDQLVAEGLYTFNSWHMGYTLSGPAWTTMLTGVWDPSHGCSNNNYDGVKWNEYPYFTKRAKEVLPNLKCVQIVTWNQFMPITHPSGKIPVDFFDYSYDVGNYGQHLVTDAALVQLADPELDVLYIHYDEPDGTGHGNGFSPAIAPYMNAIQQVDSEIGEVLAALQARPNFANEDWLVLLTTDHGGIGTGHGGNSNTERKIWWMAWGPSVPHLEITGSDPGSFFIPSNQPNPEIVKQTPVLADIAVTALGHLLKNTDVDPETNPDWKLEGKNWLNAATFVVDADQDAVPVKVFPNPNDGAFQVVAGFGAQESREIQWLLSDMSGRVLRQGTEANASWNDGKVLLSFDFTTLETGVYTLTLNDGVQKAVRKVVKQ